MTAARLAFIHGGVHTGACWADTVGAITSLRPGVQAVAVDLPGRRSVPGDLATLTIEECVDSVSGQIAGSGPLVLVGHSLAGVILAGVVERLGADTVRHIIFVTCCVPPNGECVVDTLSLGFRQVVRRIVSRSAVIQAPPWLVRYAFANRATPEQRAEITRNIVPESAAIVTQPSLAHFPDSVRKSWILTQRDRALRPANQRSFIRNLGGVDDLASIDAGHEVMVTHPAELARAIVQLAFSAPPNSYRAPAAM